MPGDRSGDSRDSADRALSAPRGTIALARGSTRLRSPAHASLSGNVSTASAFVPSSCRRRKTRAQVCRLTGPPLLPSGCPRSSWRRGAGGSSPPARSVSEQSQRRPRLAVCPTAAAGNGHDGSRAPGALRDCSRLRTCRGTAGWLQVRRCRNAHRPSRAAQLRLFRHAGVVAPFHRFVVEMQPGARSLGSFRSGHLATSTTSAASTRLRKPKGLLLAWHWTKTSGSAAAPPSNKPCVECLADEPDQHAGCGQPRG